MTYHASEGQKTAPHEKMHLDVNDLFVQLERSASLDNFESEVLDGLDFLYVSYENDLEESAHHPETMKRVFNFLELEYHESKTNPKKVTPEKFSGFISNADEVEKAISQSKFQHFLD